MFTIFSFLFVFFTSSANAQMMPFPFPQMGTPTAQQGPTVQPGCVLVDPGTGVLKQQCPSQQNLCWLGGGGNGVKITNATAVPRRQIRGDSVSFKVGGEDILIMRNDSMDNVPKSRVANVNSNGADVVRSVLRPGETCTLPWPTEATHVDLMIIPAIVPDDQPLSEDFRWGMQFQDPTPYVEGQIRTHTLTSQDADPRVVIHNYEVRPK